MSQTRLRALLRALTALAAATFALVAGALPVAAAEAPTPYEESQKAIVKVEVQWEGRVEQPVTLTGPASAHVEAKPVCSGFVAHPDGWIVTAGHCLDVQSGKEQLLTTYMYQYLGYREEQAKAALPQALLTWQVHDSHGAAIAPFVRIHTDDGQVLSAHVKEVQPHHEGDLALLKVEPEAPLPALEIATSDPLIGAEVVSVGFPGAVTDGVDAESLQPTFQFGRVTSTRQRIKGVPVIGVDSGIGHGMSGGPTLNSASEVVGIATRLMTGEGDENFEFITTPEELRSLLDQYNVPTYREAPPRQMASAQSETPDRPKAGLSLWLVCGLCVFTFFLGVVVVLVYWHMKSRQPADSSDNEVPAST